MKEKFVIGMTRFTDDEVERAIMKVTSHMLKAPNEKHMQRLIAASHGNFNCGKQDHGDINRYIIVELEKRSHTHNWVVVLKSMVAFHRLMTDGSVEINRLIQLNRNIFCLRHIKELADSPDGAAQQSFIEQYIRYLEERSIAQQALGMSSRIESDAFAAAINSLDLTALTQTFPVLLQQMEALASVEFRPTIVDNFCTLEAYRKLVIDGKKLFALLMGRMVWLLEQFEDLPTPHKKVWLKLFIRFQKCSKLLAAFMVQIDTANIHSLLGLLRPRPRHRLGSPRLLSPAALSLDQRNRRRRQRQTRLPTSSALQERPPHLCSQVKSSDLLKWEQRLFCGVTLHRPRATVPSTRRQQALRQEQGVLTHSPSCLQLRPSLRRRQRKANNRRTSSQVLLGHSSRQPTRAPPLLPRSATLLPKESRRHGSPWRKGCEGEGEERNLDLE